jgi:hypothetical protein
VIFKKLMQYYVTTFYIALALGIIYLFLSFCRYQVVSGREEFERECVQNNGYIIQDRMDRLSCAYPNTH